MTTQPTALRLADDLAKYLGGNTATKAAAELRRQHEENQRLYAQHASVVSDYEKAVVALKAQRDALLEALKLAWPIIEKEKFMQDGCYGKNFIQSKAERARKAYEKALAAIKAVEEGK